MKKILASRLAMLMMVAPIAGLAEDAAALSMNSVLAAAQNYYTRALEAGRRVTFEVSLSDVANDFTGERAVDQVIVDVLEALSITGYAQGDEVYFAIGMEQQSGEVYDMLTLGAALMEDDAYINSTLIGGTIVVSADEVVTVLERLIDMFEELDLISAADARSFKAELPEMWAMIMQEYQTAMSTAAANAVNMEELDYSALVNLVTTIGSKLVITEPTVMPRNCDAAASKVSLTMTPAEMKGILVAVIEFVKDNPALCDYIAEQMDFDTAMMYAVVEGEEAVTFESMLDELIEELEDVTLFNGNSTLNVWLDEAGLPVALICYLPVADGNSTTELSISYTRMTRNSTVAHSCLVDTGDVDVTVSVIIAGRLVNVILAAAERGQTMFEMNVSYTDRSAANLEACDLVLDMNIYEDYDEDPINLQISCTSDTVIDGVDFTETNAVTFTFAGKEYLTLNVNCASAEADESITDGEVVRPATLSDAEFTAWFTTVYNPVAALPPRLRYALPSSVMNLMNTGF